MPPFAPPPSGESFGNTQNLAPSPIVKQSTKRERWAELSTLASVLSKGFNNFGPLKQAFEGILSGIETFEYKTASQNRESYRTLRNDLNTLFHDIAEFFDSSTPPIMTSSIINFAQGIERELDIIRLEQSEARIGTHLTDADRIFEHYRRIQALLQRLTINMGFKTLRVADEQATEARLKSLPNSSAAKYSSVESPDLRGRCTQDTRINILEDLYTWSGDDKSPRIYWLNGMAGTGKTTIAYSFCERLERSKKLAASFFCSRQLPACRDANRIVPTISYQLSRFSRPFRSAISQMIEEDPDVHNQVPLEQFRHLIAEPLIRVKDALPTDLVIVIDALDECDNNNGIDRVLSALLLCAWELPIKFFVASRPDARILDRMRGQYGEHLPAELRLHELGHLTVREDIKTYLITKLEPRMSLSTVNLDILVEQSGVLFIYASTVVRYLESDNFSRADGRLKEILEVSKNSPNHIEKDINALYATILEAAFNNPNLTTRDQFEMKLVLDTVVCSREPLSIDAMASLLEISTEKVHAALRPLFSVLHISDMTGLTATLHESFPDYLLDRNRAGAFHCDANKHHTLLAQLCFKQLKVPDPPFNICNLESSYELDKNISSLPIRVAKAISKPLLYACRYWATHYMLAEEPGDLTGPLRDFVSERFLLWMEVMNLSGYIYEAVNALYCVQKWSLKANHLDEAITRFLHDIWKFATIFSSTPSMLSTPHLYVSTLSFWPDDSPITNHYLEKRSHQIIPRGSTAMSARKSIPLSTIDARIRINSLAYSPDGLYIVSGSGDNSVRIWDARTGQQVGQPLRGHTKSVSSVVYSPDGAYIVSGSHDRTIRIWDTLTGQPLGQPLEGHTGGVYCIAYAPDGTHIVSGYGDGTIRIWSTYTAQPVGQPWKGHAGTIYSVAYSPDGMYIISGSDNGTICIWDTLTGQVAGQLLEGHTGVVCCFAYSPGNTYIASGSTDGTIRVWDTLTGRPVLRALEGHTGPVNSVAYSSDGAYIASGSDDSTIRIWDTHSGHSVGRPLRGHTKSISSVAYSPDGAYILSGSWDKAICIWDAHTRGQPAGQPLQGHTGPIHSVTYSPDGVHIISGSWDNTIRVWDAYTGQPIGQPLKGHLRSVKSVAYSPDGAHIVSGSTDKTIRIWDTHTGQPLGRPLVGHTRTIYYSVAYSPNGAHIVSGSEDNTVCIWDAFTGQPLGQPLEGHTDTVFSVAYSPDGAYIASGSEDTTVRVWNAQTRQPVGQPLRGHHSSVKSVAYSPDGISIVSGSDDSTIRIWDALAGQAIGQPLLGHTDTVCCLAYSPDGAYVTSGSEDKTVRVWDAQTRLLVGHPLRGHTGSVLSVAYSKDGTHIVSSSYDRTIRIWNMQSVIALSVVPEVTNGQIQILEPHTGPCNLGCGTDCPHMDWTLNEHGWVVFNDAKLIWVPPDLRKALLRPQNTTLISRHGCLQLDLDRNKLGDHWHEHFKPIKPIEL